MFHLKKGSNISAPCGLKQKQGRYSKWSKRGEMGVTSQGVKQRCSGCVEGTTEVQVVLQGVQQKYSGCSKGYNRGIVGVERSTTDI